MPRAASGERDVLYCCLICWYCHCSADAAALLLLLRAPDVLFCCFCCCCLRSPHGGVGQPGLYSSDMFFLLVRHRVPAPRLVRQGQPRACMMCYCGWSCSCRCSDAALLLLLCTCYYRAVLLLLLLCMGDVFAANPNENGYYASQPLAGGCPRILELKDGSISFLSCTSTVS